MIHTLIIDLFSHGLGSVKIEQELESQFHNMLFYVLPLHVHLCLVDSYTMKVLCLVDSYTMKVQVPTNLEKSSYITGSRLSTLSNITFLIFFF